MNYLDQCDFPCSETTIRLAEEYKLITEEMRRRLLEEIDSGKRKLTIPVLSEEAFNIYKINNLTQLLKDRPEELRNQYQRAAGILWNLDQNVDTLFAAVLEDIDECLSSIIINFGKEGLYQQSRILDTRLENLRDSQEKVLKSNENAQVFINTHTKENSNYQKKLDRLKHTSKEIVTLRENEKILNIKLGQLAIYAELLESSAMNMKNKYEDLEVFILSSGKNPFSWERLNAGSCTCDMDDTWVNRDYNSSHHESSVLNNFINHPTSFYLFTEFDGYERGYARGIIGIDKQTNFVKCEALHARSCNHTRRNIEDESTAELSLIAALMQLTHTLGLNELRWGDVGIAQFYGLQVKKGKVKHTPVKLYF